MGYDWNGNGKQDHFDSFVDMKLSNKGSSGGNKYSPKGKREPLTIREVIGVLVGLSGIVVGALVKDAADSSLLGIATVILCAALGGAIGTEWKKDK